jgi:hypothetical protein
MNRRQTLGLLACLPLLHPNFARADNIFVQVKNATGDAALIRRQGQTAWLECCEFEVAFNIGMPPGARMGNFEIQNLIGKAIEVSIGDISVSLVLGPGNTLGYRVGERSGSLEYTAGGTGGMAAFLTLIAGAGAVAGCEIPRDGASGFVMSDGTIAHFQLTLRA